nr:uncharacterized protein LOC116765942 [Danaus plexippus plexippus]
MFLILKLTVNITKSKFLNCLFIRYNFYQILLDSPATDTLKNNDVRAKRELEDLENDDEFALPSSPGMEEEPGFWDRVVQVYTPTSSHPDEEVESMYENISRAIHTSKTHFNVVLGDFNVKLGKISVYELKKPPQRKWTWMSPDSSTRNEIDFIMTDKRRIFYKISVIHRVKTGNDHRIVLGTLNINVKLERSHLMKSTHRPTRAQIENPESCQLELSNRIDCLKFTHRLTRSTTETPLCRSDFRNGSRAIPLKRGVRQGDVISPKLFKAALEDAFKLLEWEGLGININGEYITHLRFADDIVVMAKSMDELSTMLESLNRVSQRLGLKMNMDKTKLMSNVHVTPTRVMVENSVLEVVDAYVYLGQTVQLGRSNFEKGQSPSPARMGSVREAP